MKRSFIVLFALLSLVACRNDKDLPLPGMLEDKDWYILRAPENRQIQAVYGDIDGTLLITDRFHIYYTRDKGTTWTQADYKNNVGLAGFGTRNDTLFVMDTETTSSAEPGNRYAIRPYFFSLDGGMRWEKLSQRGDEPEMKIALNYAYSGNGIRFSIDELVSNGSVTHFGIKNESGRKITLPQRHNLNNVYFDQKSRLYIAASSPICEKNGADQFCDNNDFRGTLYISKREINY
ncbi:hypothetical protein [Dyadobacter aurulentus]|uniref:hypothetical protein n=1 Tax=Dyadobacter sp. UC 10 TaxID=2605428 RepID=UPI0011F35218|nr:hypothetical protein [Dyadobacter sp. UC 10]KAA0992667.1 hypothetical protein FXO21_22080 [Dyadobacter sp. UC 10]